MYMVVRACMQEYTLTENTYIYIYIYILLYIQKQSTETRVLHGQLTPIGYLLTQILELKWITSLSKQYSL